MEQEGRRRRERGVLAVHERLEERAERQAVRAPGVQALGIPTYRKGTVARYPGLNRSARRGPLDWEPGTSSCPLASVEEGNDRLTCTHRIAYQPHRHVRTCVHRALAEMLTRLAATPSDDARGRCQFKAARSASAARSVGGRGFAATECRPPTSDGHDRRAASGSTTGGGP